LHAFREASALAKQKLVDDETRKGVGEVGQVYATLTVLHAAEAKRG
jgi:hypothetical protein